VAKLLTQFLGLVGATSLLNNTGPGSPPPPSTAAGALALIERGLQRALSNRTPTANPVQTSDSLVTGVVTGTLNATDVNGDTLTYTVSKQPANGTVVINPNGTYTYTPNSALAVTGGSDSFTVNVSEANSAVHGVTGLIDRLIGLLSLGALHPNAASSVVQAVVPVTVAPVAQASAAGSGIVPLQMINGTEPVIDISVNGGPSEPVLVDTGSDGLVIGLQDIGLQNLATLGFPTGFGISGYSGGLYYVYATFNTTVNFGNGIVTAPTSVDVPILTFPESLSAFLAPDGAVGVLGIGPNAVGPGPSSVISALPGDLSEGVLINESQGLLEFGPNPLTALVSVSGAPNASLMVQVGNGPLESVPAVIDSGGVYGTIPSSVIGNSQLSGTTLPAGTTISVYTSDGQTLLYSYTTDGTNSPTVISGTSGDVMNTGNVPFAQQPVYISYSPTGIGTTTFDV